jgi:hypothetical protein
MRIIAIEYVLLSGTGKDDEGRMTIGYILIK